MSEVTNGDAERLVPFPDQLVDLTKIPAVETPPETRLMRVTLGFGSLSLRGRSVKIEDLAGDRLLLLNTLLIARDQPKRIPDLQRIGFRQDVTPTQVRSKFEQANLGLSRRLERMWGLGDGSPKLVEMQRDGGVRYQLNPDLVFFDERGQQLSPTWDVRAPYRLPRPL